MFPQHAIQRRQGEKKRPRPERPDEDPDPDPDIEDLGELDLDEEVVFDLETIAFELEKNSKDLHDEEEPFTFSIRR